MNSSDIFYSFAAVFILFRFYFIFKKRPENQEIVVINISDVRDTMKKMIDPSILLSLLNLAWQIAGLFSGQKIYFALLLTASLLPALFMFRKPPTHRSEAHFIFLSIIKIMIAAHIFIMHFFF